MPTVGISGLAGELHVVQLVESDDKFCGQPILAYLFKDWHITRWASERNITATMAILDHAQARKLVVNSIDQAKDELRKINLEVSLLEMLTFWANGEC